MNYLYFILILSGVLAYSLADELYEGSPCTIKNENNKPGICKFITECQEAKSNIMKGIFPEICGFMQSQVIVCCSTETISTSTIRTTQKVPSITGRIAENKCKEYSKYIWSSEPDPTFLIGADDIIRNECPFDRQPLIVGGTKAERKEFPHMVQIGYNDIDTIKWGCGGSLISDKYVLTASHCLEHLQYGDASYARMGIIDLDNNNHLQQYDIIERIYHPKYNFSSHYYDIGLVKLAKTVEFNIWVRPACLHTKYSLPYLNAIASGWGVIQFGGSQSQYLLKVVLELYSHEKCNRTFRSLAGTSQLQNGILDDSMVCAGSSDAIKDTCQGDSGGPLQIYRSNNSKVDSCMYDIIGITSFGKGCGLSKDLPAVYTRVSYYIKWIEDIVWSE